MMNTTLRVALGAAAIALASGCEPGRIGATQPDASAPRAVAAPAVVAALDGKVFAVASAPEGAAGGPGGISFETAEDGRSFSVTTVLDGGLFASRDVITPAGLGEGVFALSRVDTAGERLSGSVTQSSPDSWVIDHDVPAGAPFDQARAVFTVKGDHLVRFLETYSNGVRTVGETYVFVASPDVQLPKITAPLPAG